MKKKLLAMILLASFIYSSPTQAYYVNGALPGTLIADGTISSWGSEPGTSDLYTNINDSTCNGLTNYIYTNTTGNINSFYVQPAPTSTPIYITKITVTPCASKYFSSGSSNLQVSYKVGSGAYWTSGNSVALSGTSPTNITPTVFNTNFTADKNTDLQVAVKYVGGTAGVVVSRLKVDVEYHN